MITNILEECFNNVSLISHNQKCQTFLPTGIESTANLPDEIAKELEVLSGFNADSNPINVEFPPDSNQAPALQDYNATSSKNPSRISTLCIKYNIICEFESKIRIVR